MRAPAGSEAPTDVVVGPWTKGLRLAEARPLAVLRAELATGSHRVDDDLFSWPLLTLDDESMTHNIAAMAAASRACGAWHAPHVKTTMSADVWRRQASAGAWAATVATPHQLRTVRGWGVDRVLLANQLVDVRDGRWLAGALAEDPAFEAWLEVDSGEGVGVLAAAFSDAAAEVRTRLHPLIEVGVPGGRSGVRTPVEAVALARQLLAEELRLDGVIGYEGAVANGASAAALASVRAWIDGLIDTATQLDTLRLDVLGPAQDAARDRFLVSIGGSSYLDVVLPALAALPAMGWQGVVRAGAYVTHDHGHYAELDPWSRLPGASALLPAITVWAQVLSTPEPGLALLGAGRRDLGFDQGLPLPLWRRRPSDHGPLGAPTPFGRTAHVAKLDDQHAYLVFDPGEPVRVGDVVGLGVSHPCTTMDKWRVAAIVAGDRILDLYPLDF